MAKAPPLVINNLRGRNGIDAPTVVGDHQVVEAINGDWYNTPGFRKRLGTTTLTTTNGFSGTISSLFRHVPGTDATAAELWSTDDSGTPAIGRLAAGTAWAYPTLKDNPSGNGWDFSYASLNALLFQGYKSAQARLHVWDTSTVRRAGLAAIGTPSAADGGGGGTYSPVLRYYRNRVTVQSSGITVRRSESSASVSFTPDGSHLNATVTQGTVPNEGETHWEVEASTDNITFLRIATVAIGTTTYADTAVATTYITNPVSAVSGTYMLPKSYKFVAADQGRLLGFGSWTATDPQSRVEFSAVLGSSDVGDAERVPTGNYQGLDENDGGIATGLIGPVNGAFLPFKDRQVWKMTPSGNTSLPYNVKCLSKVIGAVNDKCIVMGEDELGNACPYWMSHRGPYRYSLQGVEYIGKFVEDKTQGANSGTTINLAASHVVAHSRWYADLRQVWFWIATGSSNDPDTILKCHVQRDPQTDAAWSVDTGGLAAARCSVLFANTVGGTMSRDLKVYCGALSAVNTLTKADLGSQDVSTSFQAYVKTKQYRPWGENRQGSIDGAILRAKATSASCPIQLSVIKDDGAETRTDTVDLQAVSPESAGQWIERKFSSAITVANARVVAFQLGDSAAANTAQWQWSTLTIPWTMGEEVAA